MLFFADNIIISLENTQESTQKCIQQSYKIQDQYNKNQLHVYILTINMGKPKLKNTYLSGQNKSSNKHPSQCGSVG